LTGRLPFRGPVMMILTQVLHDEPAPPRRLNRALPRDLETVCLKALAKDPGKRYATAGALAEDLRRLLAGGPGQARGATRLERALRWVRRHPSRALASALAVLALLLGGMTWLWHEAEQARGQAEGAREQAEQARGQAEQARGQAEGAQQQERKARQQA